MKKKTILLYSVAASLLLTNFSTQRVVYAEQEASSITVKVNGSPISFDVNPTIENGTTMVQFRPVFEKLGLQISWNESTKTVTGTKPPLTIQLSIGNKIAIVDEQKVELAEAPHIVEGNTLIPLRFIGESSGKKVLWDNETRTVNIIENSPESVIDELYQAFRNGDFEAAVKLYDKQEMQQNDITEEQLIQSLEENPPKKVKSYHLGKISDIDSTHKVITVIEEYENGDSSTYNGTLIFVENNWKISLVEQLSKGESEDAE